MKKAFKNDNEMNFLTCKNEENSLPADLNHKNYFRQNEQEIYYKNLDQYKEIKITRNRKVGDEYEKIVGYL